MEEPPQAIIRAYNTMNNSNTKKEILLWSIAFPGFGQLLNGKLVKGSLFILLEFLVNMNGNINIVIIASFYWDIKSAVNLANYQWLMFYPCIYVFAIWDAYRDAGGGTAPFTFLPFVLAAYLGTIGVIFSPTFAIGHHVLGPIWAPILSMCMGVGIGLIIQQYLNKNYKN